MFVSEIRETRCRYAGAMSEISGHGRPQRLAFGQKRVPYIAYEAAFILFSGNLESSVTIYSVLQVVLFVKLLSHFNITYCKKILEQSGIA